MLFLALPSSPALVGDISYTLEVIQILQSEKTICARYEVNNTLGTCDSNLIEMSVERQALQIHRISVFVSPVSSSLFPPSSLLCLSLFFCF